MSQRPSRRGFLGMAAVAAAAAPVICSGHAFAADPRELPIVNRPDHPGALHPSGSLRHAQTEPLNATVDCALSGRRDR
ncbi:twin-arginine translocation signal domain-containing protein [Streptomyces sp. WMMC500]|uniref:twin-arginine translocation signal domain-containing protein n=1 Tax=Streptomyces sp. WMMC500 TaxID=3015154 RepID=UPI00248C8A9A|nr:twin-arginine translocation signal domain-containing protein [Streptomyces sp. WMMC500]WBB63075.1 twin-arginine translocation signal domain-containing protein [Streptomyces sp. WMMC500]